MKPLWFIAVVPPRKIIEKAQTHRLYASEHFDTRHGLRTVPHITLFPPFAASARVMSDVGVLLSAFFDYFRAFRVDLEDFKAFKPRVIYIDVLPNKKLNNLQAALAHFMIDQLRIVRKMEHRQFHPHLTIAHRDLKKEIFPKAWEHFKNLKFRDDFVSERIVLFRHDGHTWKEEKLFMLAN